MDSYAVTFGLAAATCLALTIAVRWAARRLGVVDRPDGFRKVHGRNVPLLGGVAILGAFTISLFACSWLTGDKVVRGCLGSPDFLWLLCGAAAVVATGAWDDARGLRARWKLLFCSLVALGMYIAGYRIEGISNPLGAPISLGWLAPVVTVFWFLGCMNAINLIDGMDGVAAGVVLFASAALFATSNLFGNASAALFCAALAGSTLSFLVLNSYPASIFLGDSGSLLLGFLIAAIGLRSSEKSHAVVGLLIPVIALGLPIMDTTLAILRRWAKEIPMSASDHQHIHHKLVEMGINRRVAVLFMYGGCLVLAEIAFLISAARNLPAAMLLAVLGLGTFLAVRILGRHEIRLTKQRVFRYIERRRCSARCRAAAYVASTKMRYALAPADLWGVFSEAAEAMELDHALMVLFRDTPDGREPVASYDWRRNGNGREEPGHTNGHDDALWSATFALATNGAELGQLHVSKATNGSPLGAEIPDTLELLSKALAINLERVQLSPLGARGGRGGASDLRADGEGG